MRLFFINGLNLAEHDVLITAASSVGLDSELAKRVLEERSFSAAVDQDWQLSRSYGVTGVPTFVADGRGVVGAQQYEVLARLVEAGGAMQRPQAR